MRRMLGRRTRGTDGKDVGGLVGRYKRPRGRGCWGGHGGIRGMQEA